MSEPTLSVVIAVQHAGANLPAVLAALQPARHTDVEFIVCEAGESASLQKLCAGAPNLRMLHGAADSAIPLLWRDGIRAARADRVATTTAHCIPAPDWVDGLVATAFGSDAGIGGAIDQAAESDALGWAIFLLRYASFAPPQSGGPARAVAADNALYRRAELIRHADLLADGFWEPAFHDRFRADGFGLRIDPQLIVYHRNRYTAGQFMAQRLRHGRAYGLARGGAMSRSVCMMFVAASPAIPFVLLRRIVAATSGRPRLRRNMPRAAFWLMVFLVVWTLGEAGGYVASLGKRR